MGLPTHIARLADSGNCFRNLCKLKAGMQNAWCKPYERGEACTNFGDVDDSPDAAMTARAVALMAARLPHLHRQLVEPLQPACLRSWALECLAKAAIAVWHRPVLDPITASQTAIVRRPLL